jgi:hypothetical protein
MYCRNLRRREIDSPAPEQVADQCPLSPDGRPRPMLSHLKNANVPGFDNRHLPRALTSGRMSVYKKVAAQAVNAHRTPGGVGE